MTIRSNFDAAASNLADVLRCVRDLFAESGDTTTIMVGKKYLDDFGIGAPPRVLFVPEPKGQSGDSIEAGRIASVTHSCNVLVRGAESGDDFDRFSAAYDLSDKAMSAVKRAAPGRVEFSSFADDSPLASDAYGADVAWSFTYRRDVRHDPGIMGVKPAPLDTTPPRPQVPPGNPADAIAITTSTVPKE